MGIFFNRPPCYSVQRSEYQSILLPECWERMRNRIDMMRNIMRENVNFRRRKYFLIWCSRSVQGYSGDTLEVLQALSPSHICHLGSGWMWWRKNKIRVKMNTAWWEKVMRNRETQNKQIESKTVWSKSFTSLPGWNWVDDLPPAANTGYNRLATSVKWPVKFFPIVYIVIRVQRWASLGPKINGSKRNFWHVELRFLETLTKIFDGNIF